MKNILLAAFMLFTQTSLQASECYRYHTPTERKMLVQNNVLIYQETVKDRNGFSFVAQQNRRLSLDVASYKLLGEDEEGFVVSDKNGVYILNFQDQFADKMATVYKIQNISQNTKNINGRLFFVNGKWTYLSAWQDQVTKIVISELPENIRNIKSYHQSFFVKDDKHVYALRLDSDAEDKKGYIFSEINGLDPAQTVLFETDAANNENFLADNNSMVRFRTQGDYTDISLQLLAMGLDQNYQHLKLVDAKKIVWYAGDKYMLAKRQGSGVAFEHPAEHGEVVETEYAFTDGRMLKSAYADVTSSNYVIYENKIYDQWDDHFIYSYSTKANMQKLVSVSDNILKDDQFYYWVDDYNIKSIGISANATFYFGANAYGKSLSPALVDGGNFYLVGGRSGAYQKTPLTSKIVKQLGMFYLYNNALHDYNNSAQNNENTYTITADAESLSYLGSFVDVINECGDKTPNTPGVQVKYQHFFKDKNAVYYLDEAGRKLQTIQTANVVDYQADEYTALKNLYKIKGVNGAAGKEKSIASTIINGAAKAEQPIWLVATLLLLIAGFLMFWKSNRKK